MLCELIIEFGYISIRLSQLHVRDLEQLTPIILYSKTSTDSAYCTPAVVVFEVPSLLDVKSGKQQI